MKLRFTLSTFLIFVAGSCVGLTSAIALRPNPVPPSAPIQIHLFMKAEDGQSYIIFNGEQRALPRWTTTANMEKWTFELYR